jgi:3-hydroxyacyl-[acyl-carrier-protein] dehydratase
MKLPLTYQDIITVLPHRYPFLLVDRITELEPGKRIVGLKNVTINEPFFQGHFPGNPIMPLVGGVLAVFSLPEWVGKGGEKALYFMSMDKVKFRKPVVPGDQIVFELTPLRTGTRVWKLAGKAYVDGDLVAEAELVAALG